LANSAPQLCGTVDPPLVDGVVRAPCPVRLQFDPSCSVDPESDLRATSRFTIDYGDGEQVTDTDWFTLQTIRKRYLVPGRYAVNVTLDDGEGQQDSRQFIVDAVANVPPDLQGTYTPPRINGRINVAARDQSLKVDLSPCLDFDDDLVADGRLFVDWGDGTLLSGVRWFTHQQIAHVYGEPGDYTMRITLSDGINNPTTETLVHAYENQPPVACLTTTPPSVDGHLEGVIPFTVLCDFSCSSDPDSDLLELGRITMHFGDGVNLVDVDFSDFLRFSKLYHTAGVYQLEWFVTDEGGVESPHEILTVTVTDPPPNQPPVPVLLAAPQSGPVPLTVTFDGTGSYDLDGVIQTYLWNFGDPVLPDGGISTQPLVDHTYTFSDATGLGYTAVLLVVDNSGVGPPNDRDSREVVIHAY
ncbi:MAG: PKD domain-containing protein, partial [bacterium]